MTNKILTIREMIEIYARMEAEGLIKDAAIQRKKELIARYTQGQRSFTRRKK
jgi:hypothetical protein